MTRRIRTPAAAVALALLAAALASAQVPGVGPTCRIDTDDRSPNYGHCIESSSPDVREYNPSASGPTTGAGALAAVLPWRTMDWDTGAHVLSVPFLPTLGLARWTTTVEHPPKDTPAGAKIMRAEAEARLQDFNKKLASVRLTASWGVTPDDEMRNRLQAILLQMRGARDAAWGYTTLISVRDARIDDFGDIFYYYRRKPHGLVLEGPLLKAYWDYTQSVEALLAQLSSPYPAPAGTEPVASAPPQSAPPEQAPEAPPAAAAETTPPTPAPAATPHEKKRRSLLAQALANRATLTPEDVRQASDDELRKAAPLLEKAIALGRRRKAKKADLEELASAMKAQERAIDDILAAGRRLGAQPPPRDATPPLASPNKPQAIDRRAADAVLAAGDALKSGPCS